MSFVGMTLAQAAEQLGKPLPKAIHWLKDRGYRYEYGSPDAVIRRVRTANEIADEIAARVNSTPPTAPCWRCGARGECAHR